MVQSSLKYVRCLASAEQNNSISKSDEVFLKYFY